LTALFLNELIHHFHGCCGIFFFLSAHIKQSVKYDITPIICIGESKEDRDAGRTEEAIHKQLQILLDEVNIHKVIIAYEPVWSIGTGITPTPEEVENV
ncbi:triose-phosphate isomerase, partial [Mycoplasmopsis bovis]|uniref:triose-phosphate isomerase n=1 Tax=Mycoplasmopsis bovis TaxID=28903 RepID=UPI003D28D4C9